MSDSGSILLHDEDQGRAGAIAGVLNRSGFTCRYVTERTKVLPALRRLKPNLLLVSAELRSAALSEILTALGGDVAHSHQPIALIGRNTEESRFVRTFRTGVVALLPEPFAPATHVRAVEDLLADLPRRSGLLSGKVGSPELVALVEHLRRTQRSGVFRIQPLAGGADGEALFARGVLKSARYQHHKQAEALAKLVAVNEAAFTFTDVGSESDGGGVVIPVEDLLLEEPASGEEAVPKPVAPTLLLVDDDESLCKMFSLLFTRHGYHVTVARDGAEGYELARTKLFAAVLADLNMPRLDGWGMLRLIRDDYRTRELPVAFLSCHDDYRDSLRALDAGAQAYYSKSTKLEALARQVAGLLEPRNQVIDALREPQPLSVNLGTVGPQWFLRTLAESHATGVIRAKDSWASYELSVREGQPVHASAISGKHRAEGEKAFNAFVASRGAEGTFNPVEPAPGSSLNAPLETLLDNAAATLNSNEARLKDRLLVNATQIHVNPELYALYAQVGPKQWLEAARLICEEKLPPREVLARVEISPVEVEETLKDLLRRGVLSLSA